MNEPADFPVPSDPDPAKELPIPESILVLPGPGIGMALVWWFVFLIAQGMVGIGIVIPLIVFQGPNVVENPDDFAVMILISGATTGNLLIAVGLCLLLLGKHYRQILALREPDLRQVLLIVLFTFPLGILSGAVAAEARELFQQMPGELDKLFDDKSLERFARAPWLIVFIGGCLLPGLGEEIFCRGFLGRGLVARYGVVLGVGFTSLLFGLMHLQPVQVVGTLIAGIGLQVIFLSCKLMSGPVLAHALYNSLAFGFAKFYDTLDDPVFPWYLTLASLGAFLGLCGLFFAMRTRWILPDGSEWSPGYVSAEMPPASLGAVARIRWPGWVPTLIAVPLYLVFAALVVREIMLTGFAPAN